MPPSPKASPRCAHLPDAQLPGIATQYSFSGEGRWWRPAARQVSERAAQHAGGALLLDDRLAVEGYDLASPGLGRRTGSAPHALLAPCHGTGQGSAARCGLWTPRQRHYARTASPHLDAPPLRQVAPTSVGRPASRCAMSTTCLRRHFPPMRGCWPSSTMPRRFAEAGRLEIALPR